MNKFLLLSLLAAFLVKANGQDLVSSNNEKEEEPDVEEEASGEVSKRSASILPNIGYLFRGYNIIAGNPMDPDRFDPGFKSPIFQVEYNQDRKSGDQRYRAPDHTSVDAKSACSDTAKVDTFMTESQYQQDLQTKASVSASGQIKAVKASFTASTEYSRMSKELKSNSKTVMKNEAACVVYEARIETGTPPKVTDNFRESVKKMAKDNNYVNFFNTFGTHFVEYIDMGARFTKLDTISKKSQEKLLKDGVNVNLAAEASVPGIGSISTTSEFGLTKEEQEKYEKSVESTKIVTIGSKLPENGNKEAWAQASIEEPMPIFYHLISITELFDGQYFTIDGVDLLQLKQELLTSLQGYCKVLKQNKFPNAECEGPPKGCGGGSQCSANAKCVDDSNSKNEDHLYNCVCNQGFQGDGKICERELLGLPTEELRQQDNIFDYGTWAGRMDVCPKGAFVSGFKIKVAPYEGSGDDTAANAVCLTCSEDTDRCSSIGLWGSWSNDFKCPEGSFLAGWRQNVEPNKGWGLLADDTALNNVEYVCRDLGTWIETKKLKGNGPEWGSWSRFRSCPKGQFICGLETRVAPHYHDDTALNDIKHQCCKPQFSAKKMALMFTKMKAKRKAKVTAMKARSSK